jgi:hypothetical protein
MSQLNHSHSFSSFNLNTSLDGDSQEENKNDEPRRFLSFQRTSNNLEVPVAFNEQIDGISEISSGESPVGVYRRRGV